MEGVFSFDKRKPIENKKNNLEIVGETNSPKLCQIATTGDV